MFDKKKKLKPFESLEFNKVRTEDLSMSWCVNWQQNNRTPRVLFPEWFCIVAPATKKYVTDMLGYTLPDDYDAAHSVVIFITDKMMKHVYAHNIVEYQTIDGELSSLFAGNAMFRMILDV